MQLAFASVAFGAVIYSHVPLETDVLRDDPSLRKSGIASTTVHVGSGSNVFHGRYVQISDQQWSDIKRVYIHACGDPGAGGRIAIYSSANNPATLTASSTNIQNLDFCTPSFDFYDTNFLQWPYFEFDSTVTLPNGGAMIWRLFDGADTLDTTSSGGFGVSIGTYGYLSGGFPGSDPFQSNINTAMAYFVVADADPIANQPNDGTPSESVTEYISINEPSPYGTTTASGSVDIEVYFSTPFSFDPRPETVRYYEIIDAVTNEVEYQYAVTVPANTNEAITVSESVPLSDGSKTIRAMYLRASDSTVYSDIAESFFNVATNTYLTATGLENPNQNPSGLSQIVAECESALDVACQLQKVFVFLFVPSQSVLDRFSNTWQTIRTKPPFGYITGVIDQLGDLNQAVAPAFTWPTIPFIDTIFHVFRDSLGLILWGVYAIFFYRERLTKLDI